MTDASLETLAAVPLTEPPGATRRPGSPHRPPLRGCGHHRRFLPTTGAPRRPGRPPCLRGRAGPSPGCGATLWPNRLNPTEGRAVAHTARRRAPSDASGDRRRRYLRGHCRSPASHGPHRRGSPKRPLARCHRRSHHDVVHIGIGAAFGARPGLRGARTQHRTALHFLANVDGVAAQRTLAGLNPTRTVIIVASKSFSTLETR